ncbi:Annexin A5 [Chionoecetes opilio]|uniref:Annexin n=1 Tax=Chionoecetes opilio TaxID=41210 RepID=A0A8J5D268_CHIOP|nr:Annexin A5 [Chionoecetes opilio]
MSEEDQPTIRTRVPLAVEAEVETLRGAMKGLGTDEADIIKTLTSCSCNQRQVIAREYAETHDRDLIKDLTKELSGHFEDVVVALMTRSSDFLARELKHAIDEKDGEAIVQILFACEPPELNSIKASYEQHNDDTLEEDLEDETKGVFEDVVVGAVTGNREEGVCELTSVNVARAIFNDDNGVNKEEVVKAFSSLSYKQLEGVLQVYYKIAGRTLGEAFDLEFKGKENANMQALFKCLQHRHVFLAAALHKAMAGPGTRDRDLIRLVVSRAEVDLQNIKDEYLKMYDTTLEAAIKGDTSGDYKKVLLALLHPNY